MPPHPISSNNPQVTIRRGPSIEVLRTREFKKAFLGSLSREIAKMAIVSPFVTPIPGFASTVEFFRNLAIRMPNASFDFVTAPPHDKKQNVLSWNEANLIAQLGVTLIIRPRKLHSKVYYVRFSEGDSSSFVGSANFTKGGFQTNDETVAYWRRSEPDIEVERELARLTGPGSYDLLQWTIKTTTDDTFEEADDAN